MKIASEPKKRRPNKLEENLLGQFVDRFRPGQNYSGWLRMCKYENVNPDISIYIVTYIL